MSSRKFAHETNDPNVRGGISRRSFIVGGSASLAAFVLPCIACTEDTFSYALSPSIAYAEEGQDSDPEVQIIVLSRSEIGFQVYDVTESGNQVPVSGAKVAITSFLEGAKKLEKETDENGAVVFDVSDCATLVDTGTAGVRYRFEGSVTVSNGNDYRICTLTKIRVDGGTALAIPCCKIVNASVPYFEYLSFNQWDMQYCNCDVLRCKEATSEVPIAGRLHINGLEKIKISFWARTLKDKELANKSIFSIEAKPDNGVVDFEKRDLFLRSLPPSDVLLPTDCSFEIHVDIENVTYVFQVKLAVHNPPFEYKTGNESVVPNVSFGQSGTEHEILTLPSSFPSVLSGSSITCWVPTLPVDFWLSPFGSFFFGIGVCASKDADSISGFKNASFQNETATSFSQQYDDLMDRWDRKLDAYRNMRKGTDPNSTKVFGHKFSSQLGASFSVQASVMAKYNIFEDPEAEYFIGKAGLVFDAYMFLTLTEQLTIGPVPVFISLNLSFDARFSAYGTIQAPPDNFLAISYVPSGTGIAMVLTFEAALSIGVGLSGFLSASIRGSGSISFYIALIEATAVSGPRHVVASAGLEADVVIQLLVFKWSGKIWSEDYPCFYDNWAEKNTDGFPEGTSMAFSPTGLALGVNSDGTGVYSNDVPVGVSSLGKEDGTVGLDDFGSIASIVTSDELLKTKEFRASTSSFRLTATPKADPVDLGNGVYAMPFNVADSSLLATEAEGGEDGYIYEDIGTDPEGFCGAPDGRLVDVAADGGIVSDVEVKIISNSFSNPRERIIVYDGITFLFRIASVEYSENGKAVGRTRLVAQIYDSEKQRWQRPKVLDIPSGIDGVDRMDMFDCDFDVCTQTDNSASSLIYQGIYVSIVSTLRKDGDDTTFFDSATDTILTVAVFNRDLRRLSSIMWLDDPGSASTEPTAVSSPCITTLYRASKPFFVVMSYLRHSASNPEDIFSSAAKVKCCFALPFGTHLYHTSSFDVDSTTRSVAISDAGSIVEEDDQSGSSEIKSFFSLFLSSDKGLSISTVSVALHQNVSQDSPSNSDSLSAVMVDFDIVNNVSNLSDVADMQPWPGHSSFLSIVDGQLQESTYDPAVKDGELTTRIVGPSNIQMSSFKISDNGSVLFFAENKEGKKSLPLDEEGNPAEAEYEERYRICASIYVDGLFSEPFPLVQTKHPLDSIQGMSGRASYAFVFTSITNMNESMADLYFLDAPVVVAASVLGLVAEQLFVEQGEELSFFLTLRNDGNVMLTGCRAILCDADTGDEVSETALSFSPENICLSVWNPELSDDDGREDAAFDEKYSEETIEQARDATGFSGAHRLANSSSAGVLIPGRSAQYRVTFTIPEDWHGTKNVYISVCDFSYETIVSAAPDGADALPSSYEESDELPVTSFDVRFRDEVFDPGMSAPSVGILSDSGEVVDQDNNSTESNNNEGSGDTSSDEGKKGSGLADTGDHFTLGAVGLAIGAAAAAFSAYSARRTALENGYATDELDESSEGLNWSEGHPSEFDERIQE